MEPVTSQANRVLLSVDQFSAYDFSGRIFTPLEEQESHFVHLLNLL